MTKEQLISLLQELDIPFNEGIQSDINSKQYPRIVFWDYIWEPLIASGKEYSTNVTYQISGFSKESREEKIIKLKQLLATYKIFPIIQKEYVNDESCWHFFFPIEVLEKIG